MLLCSMSAAAYRSSCGRCDEPWPSACANCADHCVLTGMFYVPANMVGWQDKPCPLQGRAVGRSSSCAASGKKFKNCCGTKLKS